MKKWNKLLALLLAMVMALGTTVTAYADGEEATEPAEDVNTAENVETTEEPAEDAAPAESERAQKARREAREEGDCRLRHRSSRRTPANSSSAPNPRRSSFGESRPIKSAPAHEPRKPPGR